MNFHTLKLMNRPAGLPQQMRRAVAGPPQVRTGQLVVPVAAIQLLHAVVAVIEDATDGHAARLSTRDDKEKETLYLATVPRARIGADRFAIQVQVEDDDWGELKQHATWSAGNDAEEWFQAWLR